MNPIPVLLITYNRLEYSKKAFESIVKSPGLPIALEIWDNASTDGTREWLDGLFDSAYSFIPNIPLTMRFNDKNVGLAPAINQFFRRHADAPYVVKVDNDTVLPENWLADLMDVMCSAQRGTGRLGAVSGTCLRPYGLTFAQWVEQSMTTFPYKDHFVHFNTYVLGTGVLINMDMIRERGLLFERFPRSIDSGQDDPCLISGWTAYTREAAEFEDWRFAFYSKVPVQLLNIKEEHVLSNDYPEYDAEIQAVRDQGNAWWDSVGGLPGVRQYVQDHGGLEKLHVVDPDIWTKLAHSLPSVQTPANLLTEADNLEVRASFDFWDQRVRDNGTTRSTFLDTPQARINEFTAQHMRILQEYMQSYSKVLDVGCGWGRMSLPISKMCAEYIGVDFIPELIDKAKESLPELDFRVVDARKLPFEDASFDLIVSVTTLSSFANNFDQILAEFKRVLVPSGKILFLEEQFARIDWKLEHA